MLAPLSGTGLGTVQGITFRNFWGFSALVLHKLWIRPLRSSPMCHQQNNSRRQLVLAKCKRNLQGVPKNVLIEQNHNQN